ncbi:ATP-binding cassette domain-containing protein, partial [Mobiluncus curtisii]
SGAVLVGNRDVRELTTEDLMSQISMVFQDVYLFDDTLEANIRIGNPNASKEALLHAAELAGVNDIVNRLPDGWNTNVGEGGCALSGGERQRVSIARAILKNAPIVLFDEATSALDAENEANLLRSFEVLRRQSTMLVIAHKLHTITQADQIVVLDNQGQVAQIGTHNELVSCQGIYREFWDERQAASGWQIAAE